MGISLVDSIGCAAAWLETSGTRVFPDRNNAKTADSDEGAARRIFLVTLSMFSGKIISSSGQHWP
jgi:hypothetical protein